MMNKEQFSAQILELTQAVTKWSEYYEVSVPATIGVLLNILCTMLNGMPKEFHRKAMDRAIEVLRQDYYSRK